MAIQDLRDTRRRRLALLLVLHGQTGLAEKTGLSPAYLYQMGKGEGKSARGISDETARKIEAALQLGERWFDDPDTDPGLSPAEAANQAGSPRYSRSQVAEEPASYRTSQSARPDPRILAQTQQFLAMAYALQGKEFDLLADADLFADAYEWLAEDDRPIDSRNLVDFGRWLAARRQAGEEDDEQKSGGAAAEAARPNRQRAAR